MTCELWCKLGIYLLQILKYGLIALTRRNSGISQIIINGKGIFLLDLTFKEGRWRGQPSSASIPPRDPWFVNLSIWKLIRTFQKFITEIVIWSVITSYRYLQLTADNKRKLAGRTCREEADLHTTRFQLQQSSTTRKRKQKTYLQINVWSNITAMWMKPMARSSDK